MAAYTAIDDPSAHFQTLLYTGDGGSNRTINFDGNSDLQPDFLWVKKRSASQNHYLANSSVGISRVLYSNSTGVEANETSQFKSVHSDGWVQGADNTNTNTATFVAWGWKVDGSTRTTFTESGDNPGGGRQVSTTAGFSIIDFTGTGATGTIAHGLGAVPEFMIVKNRGANVGHSWIVYHKDVGNTHFLSLNETGAPTQYTGAWADTSPTSSVLTVQTGGTNADGETRIAYVFTPIQGYSKFGAYKGNGSENGPFVYTGFKPAWILFKNAGASEEWVLQDTTRSVYNPVIINMRPDSDIAEASASSLDIDFLSNGFKNRSDQAQLNSSGVKYVYAAFAEQPFVTSDDGGSIPCTAR